MKKIIMLAGAAGLALSVASTGFAQTTTTTTTTTWATDQGAVLQNYATTQKYQTINNPAMVPAEGMVVPQSVTLYPLPRTVAVPQASEYEYTIVNNQPIVVDRTTRKIVHTWTQTP
jgi:hypothetical protein